MDKEWLINEYNLAFRLNNENIVPTCEKRCVNCGVCKNLNTHKVMAKEYKAAKQRCCEVKRPSLSVENNRSTVYRIKLTKTGNLRFLSHLDWQNTFLKALARTDLKVAYSQGFNPTMKVSMGIALPLFCESECELVDIELNEKISVDDLKLKLEKVLPEQSKIISIVNIDKSAKSVDTTAQWAEYKIDIFDKTIYDFENFMYNTNEVLSSEEIFIGKKNKKGLLKKTDVKQSIKSYEFKDGSLFIVLKTGQSTGDIPALRADVLMNLIAPDVIFNIRRTRFFDTDLKEL